MALAFRVTGVRSTNGNFDPQGVSDNTDLSLRGQLQITVDYIDDQAPSVVLLTHQFTIPSSEDVSAITERIMAYGRMVRDARARTDELAQYVGVVVVITDPPGDA